MQHGWRVIGFCAASLGLAATAACSSLSGSDRAAAQSSASAAAALSSAEHAKPGTYGTPANPSLPNPTNVATDAPLPTASAVQVGVSISYAGWNATAKEVVVGSFVPSIVESGGSCTLTLTKGDRSAQVTRTATPSASTTSCGQLTVPGSQVSPGAWTAVIAYRSPAHHGTSPSVEVTVP